VNAYLPFNAAEPAVIITRLVHPFTSRNVIISVL
jgi:hypothetical protein